MLKEGKKEPAADTKKKDTPTKENKKPKGADNTKDQDSEESSEEDSDDDQTVTDSSNAGAPSDDTDAPNTTATDSKAEIARKKLEALKARTSGKGQKGNKKPDAAPTGGPVKKGKKMTTWDDKPVKGDALRSLDHSKDTGIEAPRQPTFDPSIKVDVDNWGPEDGDSEESEEEPSEEEKKTSKKKPEGQKKASSGLMSFFKTFTNRQLSQEDLEYVKKMTVWVIFIN